MSVRFWSCLKVVGVLLLLGSFLPEAEAAQARPAKLSVEYVYAPDGMLAGRTVNGQIQRFEYDKRGQLLAVKDAQGNDLERYVYDPAGNILSKTVHGRTTRFTYDAANQITSRTNPDGSVVQYRYDAAGRLVQEGTRSYVYGYQDKVEEIRENGKTIARFTYGLNGQLETVTRADGSVEHFYWDGLALIGRGKSTFINEPYVTGGNPIASDGKTMLNDMLGSTVGIRDSEKMIPVSMTAFGESSDPEAMYTGKPHVDGLGYAFLLRNYRTELGKWQTADPLGYPDGWNSLAYVNNNIADSIDCLGGWTYSYVGTWTNDEKSIFESRMLSAFRTLLTIAKELQNIYEKHINHACNCQIHNYTSGISSIINILNASIAKYQSSEVLDIIKADLGSSIAGAYANALFPFRNAYMKVNIATGSSYNFFTGLDQSTIRTCIHEISHAGGSDDFLDENGSPIQRWDNAHVIEDIGLLGIRAFNGIVDLTKCRCE